MIQKKSVAGALTKPSNEDRLDVKDWKLDAVEMFKAGRIRDGRNLICTQASLEDMDSVFRWMYDNLDIWSSTPEGQDEAIAAIRKGLVNVPMVSDQEINLSATLVELTQISQ